jgi:hypothetical protein
MKHRGIPTEYSYGPYMGQESGRRLPFEALGCIELIYYLMVLVDDEARGVSPLSTRTVRTWVRSQDGDYHLKHLVALN